MSMRIAPALTSLRTVLKCVVPDGETSGGETASLGMGGAGKDSGAGT